MQISEQWRAISDFAGYEVSDHGRIRSWLGCGGAAGTRRAAPVVLRTRPNVHGYISVALAAGDAGDRRQLTRVVHRLVLEAFIGPRPDGREAAHIDGDKRNNAVTNLHWCTHVENERDKVRHGTIYAGERHHRCRLSPEIVRRIRDTSGPRGTSAALARQYGVSKVLISLIRKRAIWKHV
jgi:hypothetical protein